MNALSLRVARRLVLGAALPLALCLTASAARADDDTKYVQPKIDHAPFGHVRIVVPVTSPDEAVWMFKMANIRNAITGARAFKGEAEVRMVIYGKAVDVLRQGNTDLALQLDDLRHRGVTVLVCNNSLRALDIDFHTLHNVAETDIVPSGFLEVGWLQQQGFSVDPVN